LYPKGKLIRDGIPAIIRERGEDGAVLYRATNDEVVLRLKAKLVEEALEAQSAETTEEIAQEVGDIMDVAEELLIRLGVDPTIFKLMRAQKVATYGAFDEGHVFVRSDELQSSSVSA